MDSLSIAQAGVSVFNIASFEGEEGRETGVSKKRNEEREGTAAVPPPAGCSS